MNNLIKVSILFAALAIAISSILYYQKTKVSPPLISKINALVYDNDLQQRVARITQSDKQAQDSAFNDACVHIITYREEGKVSVTTADEQLNKAMEQYVPKFIEACEDKFKAHVWNNADHSKMLKRIDELRSIKLSDGNPVVASNSQDNKEFSRIQGIINKYRDARVVSRSTGYYSTSQAKSVISKAKAYATDTWLHHNDQLVEDLKAVSRKIGESHYNYIERLTNELSNLQYWNCSQNYFNQKYAKVDDEIYKYKKCQYDKKKSTKDLEDKIRKAKTNATNYYDSL